MGSDLGIVLSLLDKFVAASEVWLYERLERNESIAMLSIAQCLGPQVGYCLPYCHILKLSYIDFMGISLGPAHSTAQGKNVSFTSNILEVFLLSLDFWVLIKQIITS